jgi:hypothetical protein
VEPKTAPPCISSNLLISSSVGPSGGGRDLEEGVEDLLRVRVLPVAPHQYLDPIAVHVADDPEGQVRSSAFILLDGNLLVRASLLEELDGGLKRQLPLQPLDFRASLSRVLENMLPSLIRNLNNLAVAGDIEERFAGNAGRFERVVALPRLVHDGFVRMQLCPGFLHEVAEVLEDSLARHEGSISGPRPESTVRF